MMTAKKWTVVNGDIRDEISADLLSLLGFSQPYSNDESNTCRWDKPWGDDPGHLMAEAYSAGLRGDEAARYAIALRNKRREGQLLQTSRQKAAEVERDTARETLTAAATELEAASQYKQAEEIAFKRVRFVKS